MKKILNLYIIIYFILATKLFGLSSDGSFDKMIFLISISIFILLLPFILKKRYYLNNIIMFFLLLVMIESILSYFGYGQSIFDILSISVLYFNFISYYLISFIVKKYKDNRILYNVFIVIMILCNSLNILQYWLYDKGIRFLSINFDFERYGELRITSNAIIISVGIIILTGYILSNECSKRSKFIIGILIVTGIYNIIFVQKTRSLMVITLLSLISMILFRYKNNFRKIAVTFILLAIILGAIVQLPIFEDYFSVKLSDDLGVIARMEAINYFIGQIKENIIFGTGIIKPIIGDQTYYYLTGPKNIYYHDDVGIIGFTNKFGIVGLIWYIILIFKLILYVWKTRIFNKSKYIISNLGIVVYINLSMFNLIMLDYQRIPIFVLLICMLECTTELFIDKINNKKVEIG